MRARIYPGCGHSICELCHIKSDMSMRESSSGTGLYVGFRCPTCRAPCILPWHRRPLNHSLVDSMLENDDTKGRYEDAQSSRQGGVDELARPQAGGGRPMRVEEDDCPCDVVSICEAVRNERSRELLSHVRHCIFEAACNGQSSVNITSRSRELYAHACLVAPRIIQMGVHSVNCNPREFTVNILHDAVEHPRAVFRNPDYNGEQHEAAGDAPALT